MRAQHGDAYAGHADGKIILDQADGQNGIAYRRVTGIDRLTGQA